MSTPGEILKETYAKGEWDFTYAIESWFSLPTREDAEDWPMVEDESWELDAILGSRRPSEYTPEHWELMARVLVTREFPPDEPFPLPQLLPVKPVDIPGAPKYQVSYKTMTTGVCSHILSAYTKGEALRTAFQLDGTDVLATWEWLMLPPAKGDLLDLEEAERNLCLLLLETKSRTLTSLDWEKIAEALETREYPEDSWYRIIPVEEVKEEC